MKSRARLMQSAGGEIVRFQEASQAFDDTAAEILALDRGDLPCMTMLLFGGPRRIDELTGALELRRSAVVAAVERLQLAGYARYQPGADARVELTEHARAWIKRIWDPLRVDGERLLASYDSRQLTMLATFITRAREIQEVRTRKLKAWLAVPASPARRSHLRGGLSPAALRRVQLFVEANLERPIRIEDLAERAALSPFHFARAFKTSAGVTPRAFVEGRRIERARQLMEMSSESLASIAVLTGFSTQSRLTTAFRKRTGFTPAAYRRGRRPSET